MTFIDYSMIHDLDAIEAAAYTSMYAAAPDELANQVGLAVRHYAASTLLMASALPFGFFNRVLCLGNTQVITESDVDSIIEMYKDIGDVEWWIQVSQSLYSDALVSMLSQKEFAPAERPAWAKFCINSDDILQVESLDNIREVKRDEGKAFGRMMCSAYDMPEFLADWFAAIAKNEQWKSFAAFDGDKIIGGGLLFIQDNIAWLGGGAVLPEARGRHLHRKIIQARMQYAKSAGCVLLTTETGEPIADEPNPSLHNIEACGFRKIASRNNYQYSR